MAYTVLPKENPARNNKHTNTVLERRDDDELIGPELHWTIDWHPRTREWWDTWRRHEIAPFLEPTDWDFLQDTALMHHEIWNTPRMSFAQKTNGLAEIRQRVSKFGATFEDRLKLRIKFADAQTAENRAAAGPPVNKPVNYKALLEGDNDS